jgi:hypothetical protein
MKPKLRVNEKGEVKLLTLRRPDGAHTPNVVSPPLVQLLRGGQLPASLDEDVE